MGVGVQYIKLASTPLNDNFIDQLTFLFLACWLYVTELTAGEIRSEQEGERIDWVTKTAFSTHQLTFLFLISRTVPADPHTSPSSITSNLLASVALTLQVSPFVTGTFGKFSCMAEQKVSCY